MRKIRAMIGMPVVCRGKRIGRMIGADISGDLKSLLGIWVDSGIRGTRYIPSEEIEMLGRHTIMTDSCGRRKRLTSSPIFYRAVSTDGQRIGAVTGAEINDISFTVEALELSRGMFDDLVLGRLRIQNFSVNRETGEVIIETAGKRMEVDTHEERNGQRTDHRNDSRRFSSDAFRSNELADRKEVESESPPDRKLDQPQGR